MHPSKERDLEFVECDGQGDLLAELEQLDRADEDTEES